MASITPTSQQVKAAINSYITSCRSRDTSASQKAHSAALEIIGKVEDPQLKESGFRLLDRAVRNNDPDNSSSVSDAKEPENEIIARLARLARDLDQNN